MKATITIEHLPEHNTDRFAVPGLDGKVGRLISVGTGCAIIEWEHEHRVKTFQAKAYDKKTGEEVLRTVTVPDRHDRGPVTLALEVIPADPSNTYKKNGARS